MGFPSGPVVKNLPANAGDRGLISGSGTKDFPGGSDGKACCLQCRRPGFDPWVRKILWRRKWQPTPVLLPGKIPWTEEHGGLQSTGLQRVGHN